LIAASIFSLPDCARAGPAIIAAITTIGVIRRDRFVIMVANNVCAPCGLLPGGSFDVPSLFYKPSPAMRVKHLQCTSSRNLKAARQPSALKIKG
jgi:hypothetical protein